MARLDKACGGDCSSCPLLANGDVELISCVLDQIFQRVQKMERKMAEIQEEGSARNKDSYRFADTEARDEQETMEEE